MTDHIEIDAFTPGMAVWIPDAEQAWKAGEVIAREGQKLKVKCEGQSLLINDVSVLR
jgi:hypothetical protein